MFKRIISALLLVTFLAFPVPITFSTQPAQAAEIPKEIRLLSTPMWVSHARLEKGEWKWSGGNPKDDNNKFVSMGTYTKLESISTPPPPRNQFDLYEYMGHMNLDYLLDYGTVEVTSVEPAILTDDTKNPGYFNFNNYFHRGNYVGDQSLIDPNNPIANGGAKNEELSDKGVERNFEGFAVDNFSFNEETGNLYYEYSGNLDSYRAFNTDHYFNEYITADRVAEEFFEDLGGENLVKDLSPQVYSFVDNIRKGKYTKDNHKMTVHVLPVVITVKINTGNNLIKVYEDADGNHVDTNASSFQKNTTPNIPNSEAVNGKTYKYVESYRTVDTIVSPLENTKWSNVRSHNNKNPFAPGTIVKDDKVNVYALYKEEPGVPPETGNDFIWTSKPIAFGEVKQGSYSSDRSKEEWSAMAGVPHDYTLFYDAGASNLSAQLIRDGQVKVAKTINGFTVSGNYTCAASSTCSCCGGSVCPMGDGSSCTPCGGHGSDPVSYCCHHGSCGPCSGGTWTVTYTYSPHTLKYHDAKGWEVSEPSTALLNAPYLSSTLTLNHAGGGKVEYKEGWMEEVNLVELMRSGYKCDEESEFQSDVHSDVKAKKPYQIWHPNTLKLYDDEKTLYDVLYPKDIIYANTNIQGSGSSGSITLTPPNGKNEGESYMWEMDPSMEISNFLPEDDKWSEENHFKIKGYNGKYSEQGRRGYNKPLFYKDNLSFKGIQQNGTKSVSEAKINYKIIDKRSYAKSVNEAENEYYRGAGKVNDIIVHSPVAYNMPIVDNANDFPDQRTNSTGSTDYLTPDHWFTVYHAHLWKGKEEVGRFLPEIVQEKGNGYFYHRDTWQWIEDRYVRFPFEVLYKGTRYNRNTWIKLDRNEKEYSQFYLPVSEDEVTAPNGRFDTVVIAKNSPTKDPQTVWDSESEYEYNHTRETGMRARHGAHMMKEQEIVGRIGNFVIEDTADPYWKPFFRQPTGGWDIPNLVPETNEKPRHYIGPAVDMYDRYTASLTQYGLNRWGALTHLNAPPKAYLPAGPGKNYTDVTANKLFLYEPMKIGYPVYFSIQSVGNYKDADDLLLAYPRLQLVNTKTGTLEDVDLYYKKGNSYKRLYPNPEDKFNLTMKMSNNQTNISDAEKKVTEHVLGTTGAKEIFDSRFTRITGQPHLFTLDRYLRTFIGTGMTEGATVVPNNTNNSTPRAHGEQAQRWHGQILIPSSAKFTKPGQANFIDTKDKLLVVRLEFETKSKAQPWELSTSDNLYSGSQLNQPTITVKDPSGNLIPIILPGDTAVVFDPNKSSLDDMGDHGTH